MNSSYKVQAWFFAIALFCVATLSFFVLFPYLSSLFLSLVFAVVFAPLYGKILTNFGGRKNLASLATVFIIIIIILLPLSFLGYLLFQDAQDFYIQATENGKISSHVIIGGIAKIETEITRIFPSVSLDLGSYAREASGYVVRNLGQIFAGIFSVAFQLVLMILGLFFFLRDGKQFKEKFVALSPLSDKYDDTIIHKLKLSVTSVVRGALLIALIQGILSGIGFAIFGVPNSVLWGTLAGIAALVPAIGTALVSIPAIVFLGFTSGWGYALGLIIWSIIAVGMVDNLFGPYLMRHGIELHPFLILLSVLGGIAFFGPIGILAGPITISLLFALFDIYPLVAKGEE
ncbi:MAG: hypothetical protein COV70_03265 [Parcubacteria group bacterium CG11_big_fil_rev_8_21_14_0_20_39_22]|nr:MAG: hypothetical protein COV70_03265 [Parcubacteria group bacterium CG11_big_fil_rev_8_21_14_0_20_39_22]